MLLAFSFVSTVDAFVCEDNRSPTQTQVPVHCCVQCCPAHNLAPTSQNSLTIKAPDLTLGYELAVSQVYYEFYPLSIDRPPIA